MGLELTSRVFAFEVGRGEGTRFFNCNRKEEEDVQFQLCVSDHSDTNPSG